MRDLEYEMGLLFRITHELVYFNEIMDYLRKVRSRWSELEPYIVDSDFFWNLYIKFLKEIGQDVDIWEVEPWQ